MPRRETKLDKLLVNPLIVGTVQKDTVVLQTGAETNLVKLMSKEIVEERT